MRAIKLALEEFDLNRQKARRGARGSESLLARIPAKAGCIGIARARKRIALVEAERR